MAITRLNVDGKPLAYKEEVTVHTENTNIHVTSEEHSGLQDLLNPFAQFNRTGKINVGDKRTMTRKLVLGLAHARDIKVGTGRPMPIPIYQFCEGTLENSTMIAVTPILNSDAAYENFITNFNTAFSGKIKATAIGTLKCGDNLYNNGIRTIINFELIGEYANRDDIFIATGQGAGDESFLEMFNKFDGKNQKNFNCCFFKVHTTTDITLNGESVWEHITNTDIHTTTAEKAEWNNKQDALQYYTESTNSVVIGDTDTNATVTLKCGNTEVVLDEAALIKLNQLLSATFAYPENS